MTTNACSSTFIFSLLISVFPSFSMKVIVTCWFFLPAWLTLKLIEGMFSYISGMEHFMVQSVFNEEQCTVINFHLFTVDQCVFLIFHESYSYFMIFLPALMTLKLWKGVCSYKFGMENLMVQSVFNDYQSMSINFHLFSYDQCVSIIFHGSYNYLMIISGSMIGIKIMKRSVFIQFWYLKFNCAICF